METNKHPWKKYEVIEFAEMFRRMSLKEKFINYIGLTFATIGAGNTTYILTQIINNKDILLSEMLLMTMYCPFVAATLIILIVYFFEPITKRLREHS